MRESGSKHAYLIMAHGNFNILKVLMKLLDDPRNDIYLSIDRKAEVISKDEFRIVCQYSQVYFVPKRLNVKWGKSSQVHNEMQLLEMASQQYYEYYHLLSGVDLPLKMQDEIHNFFNSQNKEFLFFEDQHSLWDYQHLSIFRWPKWLDIRIQAKLNILQTKLKVDRIRKYKMQFYKGYNWCSLTHEAVRYLVERKKWIHKLCWATSCADECYKQFLLGNSKFMERMYRNGGGKTDDMREIDWVRRVGDSPHIYTM